jgi:hypothetical protein
MRPAGYGGVGASPALSLLLDTHGIAFVAPPWICPYGARNVARQGFSAISYPSASLIFSRLSMMV